MAVQVYGINHIGIEVDDAQKAVAFYEDVFGLKMLRGGDEDLLRQMSRVRSIAPGRRHHRGLGGLQVHLRGSGLEEAPSPARLALRDAVASLEKDSPVRGAD